MEKNAKAEELARVEFIKMYGKKVVELSEEHNVNPFYLMMHQVKNREAVKQHEFYLNAISAQIIEKYGVSEKDILQIHDGFTNKLAGMVDDAFSRGARLVIRDVMAREEELS
jgi:hypothetical protein